MTTGKGQNHTENQLPGVKVTSLHSAHQMSGISLWFPAAPGCAEYTPPPRVTQLTLGW